MKERYALDTQTNTNTTEQEKINIDIQIYSDINDYYHYVCVKIAF